LVHALSSQKVHLLHLASGEEKSKETKDLRPVSVVGKAQQFLLDMILVSQTDTELQVMHPETYTIYNVKKQSPDTISSETVPILKIDDQFFLFASINQ
jgi:NMD protein affecting ribosome stability and mRNA decay